MKSITYKLILSFFIVHLGYASSAQTYFSAQNVLNSVSLANPTEHHWADLDGDGDADCIVVSHWDNTISWFENNGDRTFGQQKIITRESGSAEAIFAADLDEDGDLDLMSGERNTEKVYWFENLNGEGDFGSRIIISYEMPVDDIFAEDLDMDGKMDIVAAFGSTINWFKNLGQGQFAPHQSITEFTVNFLRSIQSADLNQDGRPDILFCASDSHLLGWIENTGDEDIFGPIREINAQLNYPRDVFAADLDGDGDQDVLLADQLADQVIWFENTDALGTFGGKNILTEIANSVQSVWAGDPDQDGDMDVLASGQYQITMYENLDGSANFGPIQYLSANAEGAKSAQFYDVDQDGHLDITAVYSQGDKVVWFPHHPSQNSYDEMEVIAASIGNYPLDMHIRDIDLDGKIEIFAVFSGDDKVLMFRNGERNALAQTTLLNDEVHYPYSIWSDDLNGDNFPDIVYCSLYDASMHWQPNDGMGGFLEPILLGDRLEYRSRVRSIDFDLDGDRDLLFSNNIWGQLAVLENMDSKGNFSPPIIIEQMPDLVSKFIVSASLQGTGEEIFLLSNDNSLIQRVKIDVGRNFTVPENIFQSDKEILELQTADVDGDGFKEVLFSGPNEIVMLENEQGIFTDTFHLIDDISKVVSMDIVDLDLDGDSDLIAASEAEDEVYWWENKGDFKAIKDPNPLPGTTVFPVKVLSADLNSDGFPEIFTASSWDDKIAWHQNKQLLTITEEPQDQEVCENEGVQFDMDTDKTAEYQWQFKRHPNHFFIDLHDNALVMGSQTKHLIIDSLNYNDWHATSFRCKVTYQGDSLFSEVAHLYVTPGIHAFAGFDQYLCDSVDVLLEADDPWPGNGQWSCDNAEITIVNPGFPITPVKNLPVGTTRFYWEVNHEQCPGDRDTVSITRYAPLSIQTHPLDQELVLGEDAQFEVGTSGEVFIFQWFKGENIMVNDGQTNGVNGPVLTIKDITSENEGFYWCKIYGRCDTLESQPAQLSIITSADRMNSAEVWIGPNPIRQPAEVIFYLPGIDPKKTLAYDEQGRVIDNLTLIAREDPNTYTWNIQQFKPGLYYICFRNKQKTIVKKLIIQ
jgi:hypothetical protein